MSKIGEYWFVGIIGLAILWHFAIGMRRAVGDNYVLINQNGVRMHRAPKRDRKLSWSLVSRAKRSWTNGGLVLYGPNNKAILKLAVTEFGDTATVDRVVREINRLVKLYK